LRALYGKLAGGMIGVAMAFLGWGVWALIAQQVVQVAVNALLVWPACPWRPRLRFSPAHLKELLSFGALALSARVIWIATTRLFTVLVGYYLGMTAVGFWNIALRIVDMLYDVLGGAAHNLALPIFARRQDDRATLARAYRSATNFTALTALPVFFGLAFCSPWAIELMLGEMWMGAAPVVRILAAVAAVNLTLLYGNVAIMAIGQPGLIVGLSVVSFTCAIGGMVLIKPADLTGAALVWISRTVFTAPFLIYLVNRLFGVTPLAVLKEVAVPSGAVAIMVLVLAVLANSALLGQPLWLSLLILIPAGAIAYIAVVSLADRAAVRRFTELAIVGVRGLRAS
jgi:PST family polysaccharide transporter